MRMLNPISFEWTLPTLASRRHLFHSDSSEINEFQPSCDIHENKDLFSLSVDLPGVKKEDIKIEVQNNVLSISGERVRETKSENSDSIWHFERAYGRFERSFTLPTSVSADKIEAQFENGVLNVVLPKAEIAKGRTIQIQ